jgi:hypothetical protein
VTFVIKLLLPAEEVASMVPLWLCAGVGYILIFEGFCLVSKIEIKTR